MPITVANVRKMDPAKAPVDLVYIGRRHSAGWAASPLANPFSVQEFGREGALDRYIAWLADELELRPGGPAALCLLDLAARSTREALRLGCWCSPLDCHGDVLVTVIGWINDAGGLLPEHAWMLRHGCPLSVAYDARAAWQARDHTPRPPLWDWARPGPVAPADLIIAAKRRRDALPV